MNKHEIDIDFASMQISGFLPKIEKQIFNEQFEEAKKEVIKSLTGLTEAVQDLKIEEFVTALPMYRKYLKEDR